MTAPLEVQIQRRRHKTTPYDELADAIIAQAAEDYRELLIMQKHFPKSRHIRDEITELEDFFKSDWFLVLVPSYRITGEMIMELVTRSLTM